MLTLVYTTARGASVSKAVRAADAARLLRELRCPAFLLYGRREVGRVERQEGADDRRIRWNFWYDQTLLWRLRLREAR